MVYCVPFFFFPAHFFFLFKVTTIGQIGGICLITFVCLPLSQESANVTHSVQVSKPGSNSCNVLYTVPTGKSS